MHDWDRLNSLVSNRRRAAQRQQQARDAGCPVGQGETINQRLAAARQDGVQDPSAILGLAEASREIQAQQIEVQNIQAQQNEARDNNNIANARGQARGQGRRCNPPPVP